MIKSGIPVLTATVRGMITDSSGEGIEGAMISVGGKTGTSGSIAGGENLGEYYITGVPVGTRTLRVTKTGYVSYEESVNLVAGQTFTKNVQLDPTGNGNGGEIPTWVLNIILLSSIILLAVGAFLPQIGLARFGLIGGGIILLLTYAILFFEVI